MSKYLVKGKHDIKHTWKWYGRVRTILTKEEDHTSKNPQYQDCLRISFDRTWLQNVCHQILSWKLSVYLSTLYWVIYIYISYQLLLTIIKISGREMNKLSLPTAGSFWRWDIEGHWLGSSGLDLALAPSSFSRFPLNHDLTSLLSKGLASSEVYKNESSWPWTETKSQAVTEKKKYSIKSRIQIIQMEYIK